MLKYDHQNTENYLLAKRRVLAKLGFYLHLLVCLGANFIPLLQAFNNVTLGHGYNVPIYLIVIWIAWGFGLALHHQTVFYLTQDSPNRRRSRSLIRSIIDIMVKRELDQRKAGTESRWPEIN